MEQDIQPIQQNQNEVSNQTIIQESKKHSVKPLFLGLGAAALIAVGILVWQKKDSVQNEAVQQDVSKAPDPAQLMNELAESSEPDTKTDAEKQNMMNNLGKQSDKKTFSREQNISDLDMLSR